MAIQSVGALHKFLHECEVTSGHIKILTLTGEFSRFSQQGNCHKHGITHLIVVWHRVLHGSVSSEPGVCRFAHELNVARVACLLREFCKDQMSCKRQRIRARKIVSTIEVARSKTSYFSSC